MTVLSSLLRRRRFNCGTQDRAGWHERASIAANMLAAHVGPGASVADLGCGDRKVKQLLPSGIGYHGYDLEPQSRDVARLDLQADEIEGQHDAAVLLGVLEYVADIEAVLRKVRRASKLLVVSHLAGDHPYFTRSLIRKMGWRNVLTNAEFERSLSASGWDIVEKRYTADKLTALWLCRPSA